MLALTPLVAAAQNLGDQRLSLIEDLRWEFAPATADVSAERMRDGIFVAAAAREWDVVAESAARLELTRTVRSQHQVNIELTYDARGYWIRYLKSTNLLYSEADHAIHRNYNVWVRELGAAINRTLRVSASSYLVMSGPAGTGRLSSVTAAPIPDKLTIVPPGADTPRTAAAFAGAWQGTWHHNVDHMLIVEKIESQEVFFVFSYGRSPGKRPGFWRSSARVSEDGVLRIKESNGAEISYQPAQDGQSLSAQYRLGISVSSNEFKRRPLSD